MYALPVNPQKWGNFQPPFFRELKTVLLAKLKVLRVNFNSVNEFGKRDLKSVFRC